jgi:hypothetical protein
MSHHQNVVYSGIVAVDVEYMYYLESTHYLGSVQIS